MNTQIKALLLYLLEIELCHLEAKIRDLDWKGKTPEKITELKHRLEVAKEGLEFIKSL